MRAQEYDQLKKELIESSLPIEIPTRNEINLHYGKWNEFMEEIGLPKKKKILEIMCNVRNSLLDDLSR